MTEPNTNCLAGMQCPRCKSLGPFTISCTAIFILTDDGAECSGDIEYDGGSYCMCRECEHDGIIHDFQTGEQP
jgi:hypothetical protein